MSKASGACPLGECCSEHLSSDVKCPSFGSRLVWCWWICMVLDLSLFTMVDRTGDDQIYFRDFVVGVAPLITGDLVEKLQFSFELFDMDQTGEIKPDEMNTILTAMNSTASYFGDPVMTKDEINQLVTDVFAQADVSQTGSLNYAEYLSAVAGHEVLNQFINGNGSVRYGTA